jgi:hypothetical protein
LLTRESEILQQIVSYLRVSTGKQAQAVWGIRGAASRLTRGRQQKEQTPAKFTHIADRWPLRCAQGRRGGAASNGGRLAMKRNEFAAGEGRRKSQALTRRRGWPRTLSGGLRV